MCTKTTFKKLRKPNNERKNIGRISASIMIFLAAQIEMEIVAVQLATIIIWENGGCVTATKRIANLTADWFRNPANHLGCIKPS